MKRLLLALATLLLATWTLHSQEMQPAATVERTVRFEAVDVYLDPQGEPLAAYQFELKDPSGDVAIVGIEGGDHPAFGEPPYYDPAALRHHRVIIAAFSTYTELPDTRTRVARIHYQITGEQDAQLTIQLEVASSPDGRDIEGTTTSLQKGELQ